MFNEEVTIYEFNNSFISSVQKYWLTAWISCLYLTELHATSYHVIIYPYDLVTIYSFSTSILYKSVVIDYYWKLLLSPLSGSMHFFYAKWNFAKKDPSLLVIYFEWKKFMIY